MGFVEVKSSHCGAAKPSRLGRPQGPPPAPPREPCALFPMRAFGVTSTFSHSPGILKKAWWEG